MLELMADPMQWMTEQIGNLPEPEPSRAYNPRPPGVVRPGSATDLVLRHLRRHPGRWFFHCELVLRLGQSKGQTDWALYYLRKTEQISVMLYEMPGRKPVHRYRWKGER